MNMRKEELKKDRESMAVWYQQCAAENHKNATRFRKEGKCNEAFAWQKTAEFCYSEARKWYARSQEI